MAKVDSAASKSGLVEPVEPVEPVKSITDFEDSDGQDSLMDEVVNRSLKKKSVSKLELKASSALKAASKVSDYDADYDEPDSSIAKGNFVESSIKQALKIKQLE